MRHGSMEAHPCHNSRAKSINDDTSAVRLASKCTTAVPFSGPFWCTGLRSTGWGLLHRLFGMSFSAAASAGSAPRKAAVLCLLQDQLHVFAELERGVFVSVLALEHRLRLLQCCLCQALLHRSRWRLSSMERGCDACCRKIGYLECSCFMAPLKRPYLWPAFASKRLAKHC